MNVVTLPVKRFVSRLLSGITSKRVFNGYTLKIPLRSKVCFTPFKNYQYEIEEWESIKLFGRPGCNFLDIGANLGIVSAFMSAVAGDTGSVIACEPNPGVYSMMVELLEQNGCNNVVPLQALVLDSSGRVPFNLSSQGRLGVSSSVVVADSGSRQIILPAITVDELCPIGRQLDYIKIDAEGAENMIVRGALKTIATYRPVLQIEVHGQYVGKEGVTSLFGQMLALNYIPISIPIWKAVSVEEFSLCTHCHAIDGTTGEDMAFKLYGQMVFIPKEREDLLRSIQPRKCAACWLS